MAASYNAAALSRPEWGGANADVDLHIEAYEGDIDGSFRVESLFRQSGLTNFKSVANNSNTWRGDRIAGAVVAGRKSGNSRICAAMRSMTSPTTASACKDISASGSTPIPCANDRHCSA